jgi:hypothetical protein
LLDFSKAPCFGRVEGLKTALTMLHDIKSRGTVIVETGTTRGSLGGGVEGDGWATLLFGWYCKSYEGKITTIDIVPEAIEECKEITKDYSDVISYRVGNSVEIIAKDLNEPIDLLYLDSANDPQITLNELKAAESKISNQTIIYIDDTSLAKKRPGGVCKGILAHKYLFDKGWRIVFDNGDQIIMKYNGETPSLLEKMIVGLKTKYLYKRVLRRGAL